VQFVNARFAFSACDLSHSSWFIEALMVINQKLFLLVLVGLAVAHVMSSVGEWLIRRGALQLDRDTIDRIWARDARTSTFWKSGESIAVVVMIAGMLKAWGIIPGKQSWGIPAVALGFGLFCASSIVRAWLYRAAFAAEAPGSKASRGALFAGVLTTLAECAVGFAVCGYIYSHLPSAPSASSAPSRPTAGTTSITTSSSTSTSTNTAVSPKPKFYVSQTEALELLPGKDVRYLQGLVDTKRVRTRQDGGKTEYHRDDIVKEKEAGLPGAEELNLEPVAKPAQEKDKPEKLEQ
jgi:hypothetical protein